MCTCKFVIKESGVHLLNLRAPTPSKYALQLMDILFTDEEMSSSIYEVSKRSSKPGLDAEKVQYLEGSQDIVIIMLT